MSPSPFPAANRNSLPFPNTSFKEPGKENGASSPFFTKHFVLVVIGGTLLNLFLLYLGHGSHEPISIPIEVKPDVPTGRSLPGWTWVAVYDGAVKDPLLSSRWTSQAGQERAVVDIFNLVETQRRGFFLDLASNDAFHWSNTLTLEQEFGWAGMCVEANPKYIQGYRSRSCQVVHAVVGAIDDETLTFDFRDEFPEVGGLVGKGFENVEASKHVSQRQTVSISRLLRDFQAPAVIEYLSLDIEGAEDYSFSTFPWSSYTFLVITVERPKQVLRDAFSAHGYYYLCNHGGFGDELWVHETIDDFDSIKDRFKPKEIVWEGSVLPSQCFTFEGYTS